MNANQKFTRRLRTPIRPPFVTESNTIDNQLLANHKGRRRNHLVCYVTYVTSHPWHAEILDVLLLKLSLRLSGSFTLPWRYRAALSKIGLSNAQQIFAPKQT